MSGETVDAGGCAPHVIVGGGEDEELCENLLALSNVKPPLDPRATYATKPRWLIDQAASRIRTLSAECVASMSEIATERQRADDAESRVEALEEALDWSLDKLMSLYADSDEVDEYRALLTNKEGGKS